MQLSSKPTEENKSTRKADPGAHAAWGLLCGAGIGALLGLIIGQALVGALALGCAGWVAGAAIDRTRK